MKLEAEEAPAFIVGPAIEMSAPGAADKLMFWLLEQHVGMCSKGGIGCASCKRAAELGIARPA